MRADAANSSLSLEAMCSAIYIDGEHVILTAGLNEDVVAKYRENNIHGVKGYPSGTSHHQSSVG